MKDQQISEKYANYDGSIPLQNDKHELFCQSYVEHFNREKATQDAGYTGTKWSMAVCAHRLLKKVNIVKRIEFLQKQKIEETKKIWKRTALDVLNDIDLIKNRCMGFVLDEKLKQYKIDHKTALKCLELEGKYLGMWEGDNIEQEKSVYIEGVDELED